MNEPRHIILGYGLVDVGALIGTDGLDQHVLIFSPRKTPAEIGSDTLQENPKKVYTKDDTIIWIDNIESLRVVQKALKAIEVSFLENGEDHG